MKKQLQASQGQQHVIQFGKDRHGSSCFCFICLQKKKFEAPSNLVDRFVDGNVVLFAGAGISTESRNVISNTFYEEIQHSLNDGAKGRSFPDLMEAYCQSPAGRIGMLEKLRRRLDYIYSHESLYNEATRFHRELATFFPVDTIVTTNWDNYFESECGATPFVDDKDIALWGAANRKVLKLHGTIANLGSIVATRSDYNRCARWMKSGVLGGHLKSLLATRTTVFIGYSLTDDDFLQVYRAVKRYLAMFHRQAYFVAPQISPEDRVRLTKLGLHLIETDGQFFISEIKNYAREKRCILRDEVFIDIANLLAEVEEAHHWLHDRFNASATPQILISSWYQDGLVHALERILRARRTGGSSDLRRLRWIAHSYAHFARRFRSDRKFDDAAYCEGYSNGYMAACIFNDSGARVKPPLYFHFGYQGRSRTHYAATVRKLPELHQRAYSFTRKLMSKVPKDSNVVFHHFAKLDLSKYTSDDAYE